MNSSRKAETSHFSSWVKNSSPSRSPKNKAREFLSTYLLLRLQVGVGKLLFRVRSDWLLFTLCVPEGSACREVRHGSRRR